MVEELKLIAGIIALFLVINRIGKITIKDYIESFKYVVKELKK